MQPTPPAASWRKRPLHHLAVGVGLALLAAGLSLATQGTAMARMVMFSAVSGQVLQDGKPVPGALVEREFRWSWNSESGTDSTQTDASGAFRLPPIERSAFMASLLPHQHDVRQTILIKHGGRTYKAWMFNKGNYDADGELGKPIAMICRLEREPRHTGDVFGICELQ